MFTLHKFVPIKREYCLNWISISVFPWIYRSKWFPGVWSEVQSPVAPSFNEHQLYYQVTMLFEIFSIVAACMYVPDPTLALQPATQCSFQEWSNRAESWRGNAWSCGGSRVWWRAVKISALLSAAQSSLGEGEGGWWWRRWCCTQCHQCYGATSAGDKPQSNMSAGYVNNIIAESD